MFKPEPIPVEVISELALVGALLGALLVGEITELIGS
jgi:hypothetical protein